MSTSAIEVSGEKVKAVWDKRLTETFCDICIKEILKGNRPGTHFTKDGWLKIMINFEKETGKAFSQRQLKNRWDALKKEWKAWKKLKGEDTGLGWNPIKRTVDASDDWWESRVKVVPEAQKFRTSGIDLEFEGKLDQMFMGIVATGDKAWAPSTGTLRSDFFEDVNNEIHEEDDEENVRNNVHVLNDVHISNDFQIDGNGQKRKNPEISSSHFKTGRKKSSKQIRGAARLSSQIEKLCNAADNMSQATSSLTPVMDPYGIPQAVKVLDSMSEEVMSIVENYSGDESDDEREKKEILQRMECFNQLFVVAFSSVQLYYDKMSKMVFTSLLRVLETRYNLQISRNISSSEMLGIFLYILGTGAKVSQCRERFQRSGSTISRYFPIVLEKVSRMATDLIALEDPFFSSIAEQIRNDSRYMLHFKDCIGAIDVCDFNMCFTFVMAGWEGSAHDTRIFLDAIRDPKYKFLHPPNGKYYLVDSGYPQMKGYLGPYRGQRYHLPDFRRGRPVSDFMEYEDINWAYENTIDSENTQGRESDDDNDDDDDGDDDGESSNSSGFEMELTRDAIASSLMNSL
ncbi:hypothetical protein CXB51_027669 [Gossypium anomalum]|uniref:Myb/SANT-like domain-containing protein n=1 Tax=Gossypium anomalum TaxID=47600 RepID=A0A8J5XWG1_9ROSI|nr:hypothetical protein CXB51_027669 [Gossypium anomalum]